jgi:hypothetical protein
MENYHLAELPFVAPSRAMAKPSRAQQLRDMPKAEKINPCGPPLFFSSRLAYSYLLRNTWAIVSIGLLGKVIDEPKVKVNLKIGVKIPHCAG